MIIQPPTNIPSLIIGGRVFTDLVNLIILHGVVNSSTTVNCTFRRPNASSGYTPSGSKAFRVLAAEVRSATVTASASLMGPNLLYSDNDVGIAASTAWTNRVNMGGDAKIGLGTSIALAQAAQFQTALSFLIPNGKYVGMSTDTAGVVAAATQVWLYGYEE